MGVIEHFEVGPIKALKEAYRVLKPNGLIFVSTPMVNIIRKLSIQPIQNKINYLYSLLVEIDFSNRFFKKAPSHSIKRKRKLKTKHKYYHFLEYRFSKTELENFLKKANFKVMKTCPHDLTGSKNYSIGLTLDFPFLRNPFGDYFELNFIGKLIFRILNFLSPWISSASVLCVGRSLKKTI
jgi:ubiquinone/menaquinone biosynthesis C-methylase UbiE